VLYNLHRAKEAIRKDDRAIPGGKATWMPSAYRRRFPWRGGQLRHLADHAAGTGAETPYPEDRVWNFDRMRRAPTRRSGPLTCCSKGGMQVRIVELDGGLDPDEYCKQRGAGRVPGAAGGGQGYFTGWRTGRAPDQRYRTTEGKVAVLQFLMPAVERISDRLEAHDHRQRCGGLPRVERGMVLGQFSQSGRSAGEDSEKAPGWRCATTNACC